MNFRDIEFFIKVYESRSISIASEQLFISAQGLGNVITKLEQELGCTLFNRDRAGSLPTDCGDLFYKYAIGAKLDYDRMMAEISRMSRNEKGIIRIGYSFGVMAGLTMDLTQSFQRRYPEYELDYAEMPDRMVEDLVYSGEIDIGFAAYVDKDKYDYEPVIDSEILFVPRKGSIFYDRESVTVAEIAAEPMTLRNANFATTRIMNEEFEKHGVKPEIFMNTGGILRSIKLCRDGIANTVILDSVATQLDKSDLHIIPFEESIKWPLYMIMKKDRKRSRPIDDFKEFIAEKRVVDK